LSRFITATAASDEPAAGRTGSFCVNFNAPGAGATQNHVHVHAWRQTFRYPIQDAPAVADGHTPAAGARVALALLDYPGAPPRG